MKAGELIIGVFPNMRGKGCHRPGIARFQPGKGLEITRQAGARLRLLRGRATPGLARPKDADSRLGPAHPGGSPKPGTAVPQTVPLKHRCGGRSYVNH